LMTIVFVAGDRRDGLLLAISTSGIVGRRNCEIDYVAVKQTNTQAGCDSTKTITWGKTQKEFDHFCVCGPARTAKSGNCRRWKEHHSKVPYDNFFKLSYFSL